MTTQNNHVAALREAMRPIAQGVPESVEKFQLALDAAFIAGQHAALTQQAGDQQSVMTPDQISEVNESLWAELDEIKEKTGYNEYREANRGVGHWTLMGYLLNLKHRAATPTAEPGGEAVLAALDALKDDAAVHIFPGDLEKCGRSECVVEVTSVRATSIKNGERTVPLFSREQVAEALRSASPAAPEAAKLVSHYKADVDRSKKEALESANQFLAAKPEQQAQAGEPETFKITGKLGDIYSFRGPPYLRKGDELITMQSHREMMENQRKAIEFEAWELRERVIPDLREAIAKKDAALQACVEAGVRASECLAHSAQHQIGNPAFEQAKADLDAAITQANEAIGRKEG